MNYIVISPYYPQNFQQFTIELANKGITVLGIGQEPYEQLDEPLRNSLTEYFRVENLENLDEVKRAVEMCIRDREGVRSVEKIIKELGNELVIVSGLAKGIDATAHYASIRNGGKTIGCLLYTSRCV